jgi:single-stranded DNA-binding protein
MKKGSLVGVDGRLNQRSYQSRDGRNVNVIEIVAESVQFLEKKGDVPSGDSAPAPSKLLSRADDRF